MLPPGHLLIVTHCEGNLAPGTGLPVLAIAFET